MIAYILLMIATITAAFLAIRLYRAIAQFRERDFKVVSLSASSRQMRPARQAGFVRPDRRVARVAASSKGNTKVRKPWGW
jgi:hypothetical protein